MSQPLRQRAARWAAIAALGPISGPLVARMVVTWRRGDRILAGIYGVAVLETALLLSLFAAHLLGQQLT